MPKIARNGASSSTAVSVIGDHHRDLLPWPIQVQALRRDGTLVDTEFALSRSHWERGWHFVRHRARRQPATPRNRTIGFAELTGLLDMTRWPAGMRVIVRKERPHPGAKLRIADVHGHRVTAWRPTPPPAPTTQRPYLEIRHRRRARDEDRIRVSKDDEQHRV